MEKSNPRLAYVTPNQGKPKSKRKGGPTSTPNNNSHDPLLMIRTCLAFSLIGVHVNISVLFINYYYPLSL